MSGRAFYDCRCGGMIQEEWDASGFTMACDSCNDPCSKVQEEEFLQSQKEDSIE